MGRATTVGLLLLVSCAGLLPGQEYEHLEKLETEYLVALLAPDVYQKPDHVRVGKLPEPLSWFVPMPHRLLVRGTYDQFFGTAAVVTLLDGRPQLKMLVERAVDLGWEEVPRSFLEQRSDGYETCVCGKQQQACARILRERDSELDVRIEIDPFPRVCRQWKAGDSLKPELLTSLEEGLVGCGLLRFAGDPDWSDDRVSFAAHLRLADLGDAFGCVERLARSRGLGVLARPESSERAPSSVHRAALIDWADGAGNLWTGVLRADRLREGDLVTLQFGLRRP